MIGPQPPPALLLSWSWEQDGLALDLPYLCSSVVPWLRVTRTQVGLGPEGTWDQTRGPGRGRPLPGQLMPISFSADQLYNETMAKAFLQFYERTAQVVWNRFMEATWNYVTNITKKNQEEMVWYHFHPCPFSPCSSQGSRCRDAGGQGVTPFAPLPELDERGKPQSTCWNRCQAPGLLEP